MPYALTETTHVNKDYTKVVPGDSPEARWVLGGPGYLIEDALAHQLGLLPAEADEAQEEHPPAGGEGTPLPEDFPARTILVQHGFDTVEKMQGADLLAIPGIGKSYAANIRRALGQLPLPEAPEPIIPPETVRQ